MGGIGIWQLLIVLVIVIVIFGTKKLRNMGGDIGGAIKNFRHSMKDEGDEAAGKVEKTEGRILEGEVTDKKKDGQNV